MLGIGLYTFSTRDVGLVTIFFFFFIFLTKILTNYEGKGDEVLSSGQYRVFRFDQGKEIF
jgi:hypothetical protein